MPSRPNDGPFEALWDNDPMPHFDLCVIGSGTGNALIDEAFAKRRVALVDDGEPFGGTCLNAGCIPTKMFAYPADVVTSVRDARRLGLGADHVRLNWDEVRDRIFTRIDPIAEQGEEYREQSSNVTLFRERGRFVGPKRLQVGEETITADAFVIAAGSRPRIPDVPGLEAVRDRVHTSDTIMRLDVLPKTLVIVGGGPVAAEFAHIFSAFGSEVTVVTRGDAMLRNEDESISKRFTEIFGERVNLRLNQHLVDLLDSDRRSVLVATSDSDGIDYHFEGEQVLLALGRVPNTADLGLDAAGVAVDADGRIVVDGRQRTTAKDVYALGDISSPWMLKHVANHEMRVVHHNLLHKRKVNARHEAVPHAVFADPQVAAVGATEQQLRAAGRPYVAAVQDYSTVAYGWAMEDERHFAKLLADPKSKQLLGAHIIGPEASLLIQPVIQAMSFGLDVPTMARGQYWIHPALTEVVENALLALGL